MNKTVVKKKATTSRPRMKLVRRNRPKAAGTISPSSIKSTVNLPNDALVKKQEIELEKWVEDDGDYLEDLADAVEETEREPVEIIE